MANRLARETSPYLLQHKDNPVDWYAWGEDALSRARELDRPILLSIGYSACHWCHVMERESFEDAETAAYMSEHFVCIKVDREERPDIDSLYMEAVQSMTGHGGWPLTAFLDSEAVPFYGGTYFPPEPGRGLPSLRQVMEAVVEAYSKRREEIRAAGGQTRQALAAVGRVEPSEEALSPALLERAVSGLLGSLDRAHGGFGAAPKFPPASALELLLARGVSEPVELTLDAMASGGIYDQVGGGFARYAVDAVWLVPHFEKMLYDNALLARAYLHGWQALGHERYLEVCRETLDWALTEMRGPEGGFYSALDADSEGEEGRFYVWDEAELRQVLADASLSEAEAGDVAAYWGVSGQGNFEGRNVLSVPGGRAAPRPARLDDARAALRARRKRRVRPGLDDKRVCSWNALMVSALADAGAVLGEARYLAGAVACAEFLLERMRDGGGRLRRTFNDGRARLNAYLEDHAYLIEALLDLYEATLDVRWFDAARETAETLIARFADPERGGFFTTSDDHEQLIARRKDFGDHPIPAGNSSASLGLLRLAAITGEREYEQRALGPLRLFGQAAARHPDGFGHLLRALDFHLSPVREVALIAPRTSARSADGESERGGSGDEDLGQLFELTRVVRSAHRPRLVLAGGVEGSTRPELLRDRTAVGGRPAAFVCERFACRAPVTSPEQLEAALAEPAGQR